MLRLLRFLWTGDWRLPEWEQIEKYQMHSPYYPGQIVSTQYVVRDKVTGRIKSFEV